ncbi:MAG: uracil-DNA glycosylase [Rhodospirillales bacterium]
MAWYLDAGVDECIGETAINRFDRPPAEPASAPQSKKAVAQAAPATAPLATSELKPSAAAPPAQTEALRDAVHLAKAATSVAELRVALEAFDGCALKRTATNTVFVDGHEDARLILIGEAPGAEEDRQGLPFVGPSGKLLDAMLASIGLDRDRVLIGNTVFWRPPGNRTPTLAEVAVCQPFMERLIEIVDPAAVVALGRSAANTLLGRADSMGRLRGRWFEYQSTGLTRPVPFTALFHPAYLLRTPAQKRLAWRDLLAIKRKLLDIP